ncbi:hypothetical protein KIW84_024980 [Lathyrus oleraceus]|uniref:Uncharacterized protein n=1 Tax=Pisum sativum TaxID=3888 RepID=A0A9D4YI79_PEA|nr:hypothetical protein KIW84_024980 [Pisum sativum]
MTAKDLYDVLKDLRDIDKVIIPPKRDKRGNKYDFVRFFNVRDERLMVAKLDNTFIEGKGREVKENLGVHVAQSRGYRGTLEFFSKNQSFQFRGRRSFAEVIRGKWTDFQQANPKEGVLVILNFSPNEDEFCLDFLRIKIMEEAQGMIGLLARRVVGVQSDSEEDLGGSEDRSVRWKDEEDKREDFDANSINGGLNIEVITHDVVSRGTKGFFDKTFEELRGNKMLVVFKNNSVEQDFSPNV